MTLREAAERAVSVLGDEPRYAGLVESALRLAEVVEANDGNASLWREYLNVLRDVLEASYDGSDDFADAVDDLLAEARDVED